MENKEKFIKLQLEALKKSINENLDKLPNKELPFMEPHLRSLYFQAYFLLLYGLDNASIVLCGILLENIVKEKLFNEGIADEDLEKMNFGQVIKECETRKNLTKKELDFLKDKKEKLRNPYSHYNLMKLTDGKFVPICNIPLDEVIKLNALVKKGILTEEEARNKLCGSKTFRFSDSKEFRALAQIVKGEEDKKIVIPTFLEVDRFIRNFAKKYFDPSNKEKKIIEESLK